jgi:type I restriction enzyme, S subunit
VSEVLKLQGYDSYKNSDLEWLKAAPTHWQIKPNRAIWNERKTNNCSDAQLLSVTIKRGLIAQSDLVASTAKRDFSNHDKSKYKFVKQNDIVYNKMRMWQGAVGVSNYQGIVSPAYIVLEAKGAVNQKYYHYLLRTPGYIEESHRNSYGICDDQLSLRFEDFKRMYNIIPPKEEQDQIVRYLDSKLVKINKFIKNKKRLIELLKEQKQAVINQAVTKGLDPDAKMKPSGVDWLGDVPVGWQVLRVGRAYDVELGKMLQPYKKNPDDTLENYLCALNIGWDRISLATVKKMWFSRNDKLRYEIKEGDLIVVEGGDVGVSCIWGGTLKLCYIQNAVHRVREIGLGINKYLVTAQA